MTETTKPSPPAASGLKRKVTLGAAGVIVAAAATYFLMGRSGEVVPAPSAAPVVRVDVAKAVVQPISSYVEALGTMFPRTQATLGAKLGGQITKMPLLKNQQVNQGEIVAVFQSSDLLAQRDEAAAALAQARTNLRTLLTATIPQNAAAQEKLLRDARANVANSQVLVNRRQVLFSQGGISRKDLDASQLALTLAENELRLAERNAALRLSAVDPNQQALAEQQIKQAEQRVAQLTIQLGYSQVRAPFQGVITDQFQFEGDYVAAGARLVTLADMSEIIVKAAFADTVAAKLRVGNSVVVIPSDRPNQELMGAVSLISNSVDPASRSVEVWVRLPNAEARLRSGGSARVRVTALSVDNAIVVPAKSVTLDASTGDAGALMVVDSQSIAHERKVTVGVRSGELIQITAGLKPDEVVVTAGGYALPDGTKVQIAAKPQSGAATK
jgi:RND family efflux transporter MFP subunit